MPQARSTTSPGAAIDATLGARAVASAIGRKPLSVMPHYRARKKGRFSSAFDVDIFDALRGAWLLPTRRAASRYTRAGHVRNEYTGID